MFAHILYKITVLIEAVTVACAQLYVSFGEKNRTYALKSLGDMPIMQWLTVEDLEKREFDPTVIPFVIWYLHDRGFLEMRQRPRTRPVPKNILFRQETVMFFEFRRTPPSRGGKRIQKRLEARKFSSINSSVPNSIGAH